MHDTRVVQGPTLGFRATGRLFTRLIAVTALAVIALALGGACGGGAGGGSGPERGGAATRGGSEGAGAAAQRQGAGAEAEAGVVAVEITGFRNERGQALIALFRDDEGFPDEPEEARASAAVPIRDGRASYRFEPVAPGAFAIAVLHDESESFDMETNVFGMPQEGYGASRNPEPRFGPPRFEDAALELEPATAIEVEIEILYP